MMVFLAYGGFAAVLFIGGIWLSLKYPNFKYKSRHNPDSPHDIYFNPVLDELKKGNRND